MQLAIITDEFATDFERAADIMAEYGVVGAEVRGVWDKNISDAPDDYVDRVKRIATERGIKIVGIASSFYKCDLTPDVEGPAGALHSASARGLGDQIALLNRCVEIAQKLDTKFIRVFTFWKRGPLTPELEERVVEAFIEPAEIAELAGVTLLVENEHDCIYGTGAETARLLAKIDSPAVRCVWDPGNAFVAGEQPFPAGYEAIKPFIAHVHVKDASANGDKIEWAVPGEGECRWLDTLRALKADGYAGWLSVEPHYHGRDSQEASSRACLEGLIGLMKQI